MVKQQMQGNIINNFIIRTFKHLEFGISLT